MEYKYPITAKDIADIAQFSEKKDHLNIELRTTPEKTEFVAKEKGGDK